MQSPGAYSGSVSGGGSLASDMYESSGTAYRVNSAGDSYDGLLQFRFLVLLESWEPDRVRFRVGIVDEQSFLPGCKVTVEHVDCEMVAHIYMCRTAVLEHPACMVRLLPYGRAARCHMKVVAALRGNRGGTNQHCPSSSGTTPRHGSSYCLTVEESWAWQRLLRPFRQSPLGLCSDVVAIT
jgi:hypothetical protein